MKFKRILSFIMAATTMLVFVSCTKKSENKPSVSEFRTYNNPAVAKAAYQAEKIIKVSEPTFPVSVTLFTLQGLVTNKGTTQILVNWGATDKMLSYMKKDFGVTVETRNEATGKMWDTWSLVEAFKDKINGYILCDDSKGSSSVNIAVSLANQLNAVVVAKSEESKAKEAGLTCVLDVTGKTDEWWSEEGAEYYSKLNAKIAIEQDPDLMPNLADYSAMTGAFYSFYGGNDKSAHKELFKMLDPGGIVLGYNNKLGEYDTVLSFSENSISMIPADHARNVATLSGFKLESIKQKTTAVSTEPLAENKHTVCILMSDGDNLQWFLNDFTGSGWFGSRKRGNFNMGWGIPTTAIDLAAPMVKYCYDKMTEKDNFVMQLSGLGYTFPSRWADEAAKEKMAQNVNDYMKRSDIRVLEILDDYGMDLNKFNKASNFDVFTKQDSIDGIFYIDYYGNYNAFKGATVWSNGKPVVSAKYSLWATGNINNTPEKIANDIKAASKNPKEIDSYSFVIVHSWSGLKGSNFELGGDCMAGVQKLVDELSDDPNVDIVTPAEFISRMAKNIER